MNNDLALEIARLHAAITTERHPYLPQTAGDAQQFVPHAWVIEAIWDAYARGYDDGTGYDDLADFA